MLAIDFQAGASEAWQHVATFIPKFLGFLAILVIGYFLAKVLARVVDDLLERVGFDRWVERGALKEALERSRFDASDILAIVTFWAVFLIALQLAFGVFGPNPVSNLIEGIIAFLPNIFVALVIMVIAAALAKVVTEIVRATLGAMSGGEVLARAAGAAILVIGVFAALTQLQIAPAIVVGLFYAMLAIIVGSAVVAFGGGGIPVARRYLERASTKLEDKGPEMRRAAEGAPERIAERTGELRDQVVRGPESDTTQETPTETRF
ncbi:MAG: mechanosensitive ion channel family protein [Actinomycetota bacterium]